MRRTLLFIIVACHALFSYADGDSCSSGIVATSGSNNEYTLGDNTYQWFQYTLTSDSKVIIADESDDPDSYYQVFGSCDGNAIIYGSNEGSFNGEAGLTYYIRWKSKNNQNFSWSITETALDEGESCYSPTPAKADDTNLHSMGSREYQWYSYTATRDCKIVLENVLLSISSQFEVYTDCGSSYLTTATQMGSFAAEEGVTYYIRWKNYSSTDFYWSLSEVDFEEGENCSTAIEATASEENIHDGGSYVVEWFQYTATQDGKIELENLATDPNSNYAVYISCDGEEIGAGENSGYFTSEKDQIYYIAWYNRDDSNFYWSLTENQEVITGQTCTNAIVAVEGDNEVDHMSLGGDAWFSFSPLTKGRVTVSTCDLTNQNTWVYVYESCDQEVELAKNNNECDYQSEVTFNVEAEHTYYIMWSNYYNLTEAYYWNLKFVSSSDESTIVNTSESNDFVIYPNPSSTEFYIQTDSEIKSVKVIDACGRVVKYYNEVQTVFPIGFVQGIYLVQVSFADGTIKNQKLVVN